MTDQDPFRYAARVVPPRSLEDTQEAAVGIFGPLSSSEVAFDVCIDQEGASWWIRAEHETVLERAVQLTLAAYPGAEVLRDAPAYDPGSVRDWEDVATVGLHPAGDPALPLRGVWRDALSRQEADPIEGIVAQAGVTGSTRVVTRVRTRAAGDAAARKLQGRAEDPIASRDAERDARRAQGAPSRGNSSELPLLPLLVGGAVLVAGIQGWQWYQAAQWWHLAGAVIGLVALAVLAGLMWTQVRHIVAFFLPNKPVLLPPEAVEQKLGYPLLTTTIEVRAAAPPNEDGPAVDAIAQRVAAAYQEFFGGGISGGMLVPGDAERSRNGKPAGKELLLNARECAALWHLPARMASGAGVERAHAARILPAPEQDPTGLRVGSSDADPALAVRMPLSLVTRHNLIVAKTRRGKSTLLRHVSAGLMEQSLSARTRSDDPALVILDPHHDLAVDVLHSIPPGMESRVTHLDFANSERPVGLNLLDVTTFQNRDLAVENIVTIMHRLWPDAWGARMEGALRNALLLLYDTNLDLVRRQGETGADHQYTILDVPAVLTEDRMRNEMLKDLDEPRYNVWWRTNFDQTTTALKAQIANPVANKVGHFIASSHAERLFGQPRTTFNLRQAVEEGGVIIIDTPIGALGEGAAAMLGATMMNLVGITIEAQVELPVERRRPVVCVVDESSTLGAINYERMLSELGKFGGSFMLVTQSLAKLNSIDPDLGRIILSNLDGLTVFQTSAEDAAELVAELDESYVAVSDLVSLDDFHAYARWTSHHRKPPPFSFMVDPPPPERPDARERAAAISIRSAERYGSPLDVVDEQVRAAYESQLAYGGARQERGDEIGGNVRDGIKQQAGRGRGRQAEPPPNQAEMALEPIDE